VSENGKTLTYDVLRQAVESAAAFRCRRKLQPAGGTGDKIFPPTYAGAVYSVEQRRMPGNENSITCVLIDSVQSQANRMEEALQNAMDEGLIALPHVSVDFSKADLIDKIERVTSFEAPHRLADAILRDSQHGGKPFRESEVGKPLDKASERFATPLFQLSPNSLVFGMWDSTGPRGGLGAKFERVIVSEIVGVDVAQPLRDPGTGKEIDSPVRRGVRRDPLGIRAAVKLKGNTVSWSVAEDPKAKNTIAPSELNHSSVPFDSANAGITCAYIEHAATLSLIQLRRLHFPDGSPSKATPEQNWAARSMLAAIGLAGAVLAFERGADLRSRCIVFPEEPMTWDLLDNPGQEPGKFSLDRAGAIALLTAAAKAVKDAKLPWNTNPIMLTPSKQLVELVRKSQELTAKSGEEGGN
jgi:CRISPR-associated protein Csb1